MNARSRSVSREQESEKGDKMVICITLETQTEILQIADVRRQAEEDDAEAQYRIGVLDQKGPRSTVQRCRAL